MAHNNRNQALAGETDLQLIQRQPALQGDPGASALNGQRQGHLLLRLERIKQL
ncbi:hypothetical protein D3C75_1352800 [compost metagenome]